MLRLLLLGITLVIPTYTYALNNGLALTPPMGWLSWERFRCNIDCVNDPNNCISEKLYKDMADRMAEDGWLQAGYRYVNIDDCWPEFKRDSNGTLVANKQRFPSGIPALASYVQSRGLSLGIYGDLGTQTCGGYPGTTFDTITHDAQTFANWTVDSLKLDGCNIDLNKMPEGYPMMTKALNATGRPILYACSWPAYWLGVNTSIDWQSIATNCNYWRLFDDIQDDWDSVVSIIKYWGDQQAVLAPLAGPGHFNDPDMIICGNFALSIDECVAQFSLWAIWAAPLYLSADLRSIRPEFREILLNTEVIAVNQDVLGIQGTRIYNGGAQSIWVRPLSQGSAAVALLNLDSGGTPSPASFNLTMAGFTGAKARVRDLYAHLDLGMIGQSDRITAQVNIHGCRLFRVSPVSDMEMGMFEPISAEKLESYGIVIERATPMIGSGDHDQKSHVNRIGGGDHDKQSHTKLTIGGDHHDNKAHIVIGGDHHDQQSHAVIIGGDNHDQQSHNIIGGDGHDNQPHTIIGKDDHDKQAHSKPSIIGGDNHDNQPHDRHSILFGSGDHDKQPHQMSGTTRDNTGAAANDRHSIMFGEGDHDRHPHNIIIGGGDHDNHDKQAHGIIGAGSHDQQPHTTPHPLLGRPGHGRAPASVPATGTMIDKHTIGGDNHDQQSHENGIIGAGSHDYMPHGVIIGHDDHDKQPHTIGGDDHDLAPHATTRPLLGRPGHGRAPSVPTTMIGGDEHDQQPHTATARPLLGRPGHGRAPVPSARN